MVLRVWGGDCVFVVMMIVIGFLEFGSVDCGVIYLVRCEIVEVVVVCVFVFKFFGEI